MSRYLSLTLGILGISMASIIFVKGFLLISAVILVIALGNLYLVKLTKK